MLTPGRSTDLRRASIPANAVRRNQIALGEHHQIGAGQLILEYLLDRIVVIQRIIGGPLRGNRILIDGDAAFRQRQRIDHGHHAVDRGAGAHRRPVECLQQWLRQRQPGGLDHDGIQRTVARQQFVHGRDEIVGDGAADAAIGEFDDIAGRAGLCRAFLDQPAVKPGIAELIDDHGDAAAIGLRQQRTQQRGLAGAEKSGEHSDGDTGHCNILLKANASARAEARLR